jgi:hypothetical protein
MSKNPYKDYYEASDDLERANARKRIKDLEYASSWTGESVKTDDEYNFSGGA